MDELTKEEKRRQYQRDYYRKNREKLLDYRKKWVSANKESVIAANAKYYERKLAEQQQNE